MRFLREWVLHNWGLKLLALGLSFLLWATYTSEPVLEVGYQVPIEFVNIPANLEITNDVTTEANVRLRGRSALLRRITPADIDVHMDFSHALPGDSVVTLNEDVVKVPYGAKVVRLTPAQIRVVLSPRHTRPVSP